MKSKLILCVLLGMFLTSILEYNDAVVFKFTNFVCDSYNQSWFVFHQCRLKAVGRNKVLLNFNGTVLVPVKDISVRMQFFKRENGYRPWLYDIKVDVCEYLRKPNNPIVAVVYALFKQYTNFNHTCTYVGLQIVKDFYLRHDLLRLPVPTGDYLLSSQWYFDKKLQFVTNVSYMFEEDLMKRN